MIETETPFPLPPHGPVTTEDVVLLDVSLDELDAELADLEQMRRLLAGEVADLVERLSRLDVAEEVYHLAAMLPPSVVTAIREGGDVVLAADRWLAEVRARALGG
jgi:predicted nuclease with TOPRIM domain